MDVEANFMAGKPAGNGTGHRSYWLIEYFLAFSLRIALPMRAVPSSTNPIAARAV